MEENQVNLAYGNNNLPQRSSDITGVQCSNLSCDSFPSKVEQDKKVLPGPYFLKRHSMKVFSYREGVLELKPLTPLHSFLCLARLGCADLAHPCLLLFEELPLLHYLCVQVGKLDGLGD